MKSKRMFCILMALLAFSILNISMVSNGNMKTLVSTYMMSGLKHITTAGKNVLVPTIKEIHERNITAPSLERELARRSVEQDNTVFWNYLQRQMIKLKILAQGDTVNAKIDDIIDYGREIQGAMRNDLADLGDNVDRLSEWRYKESLNLEALIQTQMDKMQNPKDCSKTKRLVCRIKTVCGFGCMLRHMADCMILAYSSNRTVILLSKGWRYAPGGWETVFQPLSRTCNARHAGKGRLPIWGINADLKNDNIVEVPSDKTIPKKLNLHPRAIPDDIADSLIRFHRNPSLWWVGQIKKYLVRPREHLTRFIDDKQKKLNFTPPVVGVHVRRTDKLIKEAKYHGIDEYMRHVVDWYDAYEQRHPGVKRRVYIATDDPSCVTEAKEKYPTYNFINDNEVSQSASPKHRYESTSILGLMADVHFLSNSNYFVCTLSSLLARTIYALMQTKHGDASNLVASLDMDYSEETRNSSIAIIAHTAKHNVTQIEIDLQVGDIVLKVRNLLNGYSEGTNERTRQTGFFPSYKIKDEVFRIQREEFTIL